MRRATLAALGLVVASAGPVRSESIFALNLLGERFDAGDARLIAVGGFTQILDDSLGVLQYNPASLAWNKRVTFGVSGYVTRDANQTTELEEVSVSTKLSSFSLSFPVYGKRVSAGFGYRGRYDPDGSFTEPLVTSEGDAYNQIFERDGGLWSVPFLVAIDMGDFVKLGGFYALERGTIENRLIFDFEGETTVDAVSVQRREFSGTGFGAGAIGRPLRTVSLGVTWESRVDYDTEVQEIYTNSAANESYSETTVLPERWTLSASWRLRRGMVLFGGYSASDFKEFRGLGFPEDRLATETTAAFGIEYRIGRTRFPIRASVRFDTLPYTLPAGEEIDRFAVTLGTGLILKGNRGKIDTALQFAKTGSVETNTFEDQSVRFYLSIAGSEEWKRERGTRY